MDLSDSFTPTHWDRELEEYVEIHLEEPIGCYRMKWAGGYTGSNPPGCPMDRYIPLADAPIFVNKRGMYETPSL
jgi:hypothetical protein